MLLIQCLAAPRCGTLHFKRVRWRRELVQQSRRVLRVFEVREARNADDANFRAHADDLVTRYPAGGEVTVYYQPGHPEQSLIEPGVEPRAWALPVVGLVLLAAGSIWLRTASRQNSPPAEPAVEHR